MENDVPIKVTVSEELAAAVDQFQAKNNIRSRTETLRVLIERGLTAPPARARAREATGDKCRHPIARRLGDMCPVCGEKVK